ncbi:MAG: AAA family ATPase [Armatimonadota bacterium]
MSVQVLIAEHDAAVREEIREALRVAECEIVGLARDGEEAVQLAIHLSPHVALIDHNLPGVSGLQACEIMSVLAPETMPVLIADAPTPEFVEGAMRVGARAVIEKPLDAMRIGHLIQDLTKVWDRRRSSELQEWKDPSRYSKMISVTGGKGGIGKSTIAVNLSAALSSEQKDGVVLVDMHPQFGDIAMMLNATPRLSIADMAGHAGELDPQLVGNYITKHPSGVHFLVSSTRLNSADDAPDTRLMEELFYVLRRMYRYIVIDVPAAFNESTLHVLTNSNRILLVANLVDLTAIANAKKLYDVLLEEQIPREKIGIVLNQIARTNKLQAADVEGMFDCEVAGRIPEDGRTLSAVNQGVPLVVSDADSAFSAGIGELVEVVSSAHGVRGKS